MDIEGGELHYAADSSGSTVSLVLTSHNIVPEGRVQKSDECVRGPSDTLCTHAEILPVNEYMYPS